MSRGKNGVLWGVFAVAAFVLTVRLLLDDASRRRVAAGFRAAVADEPAVYQSDIEERPGTAIAILIDTSGSMLEPAPSGGPPKHVVAAEAVERVLLATDEFARRRADYPIKVSIIGFAGAPWEVLPFRPYEHAAVSSALARLPRPGGGTAIGAALQAGRAALYRSGAARKYILVVTDGQNTVGTPPDRVARDIFVKSRGSVSISFVAFDTDPAAFGFLRDVGGDVVAAQDAKALQEALRQIYEGKILAEAVDGEAVSPAGAGPSPGALPHGRAP